MRRPLTHQRGGGFISIIHIVGLFLMMYFLGSASHHANEYVKEPPPLKEDLGLDIDGCPQGFKMRNRHCILLEDYVKEKRQ